MLNSCSLLSICQTSFPLLWQFPARTSPAPVLKQSPLKLTVNKLSTAQLRRVLSFESRYELDGFLKQHEAWLEYTWHDLEQDRETHRRLGL